MICPSLEKVSVRARGPHYTALFDRHFPDDRRTTRLTIRGLAGNSEADGRGRDTPPASRAGASGDLSAPIASFFVIKAQLSPGFPRNAVRAPGQAGTGGARGRTMRARICESGH